MSDLTDALIAKGYTTTRYFTANGTPAGAGHLHPTFHAYADGQAMNYPSYAQRYGIPIDGQLYHPQSKVENRLQIVRAAEEARQAGFFEAELGLDLPVAFDGKNLQHIEMCDDLDFCLPPSLWIKFWQSYGPPSEPETTAPAPPHPQPFDPSIPADMQRTWHDHPEFLFRSRVYLETGLGTPEAWDKLFAEKGEPVLAPLVAAPGFNPLDPNGPAVAVEASHFLKIWAAYTGASVPAAPVPAAPPPAEGEPEPAAVDPDVVVATLELRKDAILAAIKPGIADLVRHHRAASPALAKLEVQDAEALAGSFFDLLLTQVGPALTAS